MAHDLRAVSWCLAGSDDLDRRSAWMTAQAPDIVALQEVPSDDFAAWRDHLASLGLTSAITPGASSGRRRVMVASRWPVSSTRPFEGKWPERFMEVDVAAPKAFRLVTGYVPFKPGPGPDVKLLEMLTARRAAMPEPSLMLAMMGTPALEFDTGEAYVPMPFSEHRDKDDAEAEFRALTGPDGWVDLYREANPRVAKHDHSFTSKGRYPRRVDHVHGKGRWSVKAARYDHGPLRDELGDHAPLVADLSLR